MGVEELIATLDSRVKVKLRPISEIVAEKRTVQWLLPKVIEANVLAVLAGKRGTLKSFIALHWSMQIALQGGAIVILSGEGAGLDRRVDAWMRTYGEGVPIESLPVLALERTINLNAEEMLIELIEAIDMAHITPALILIDTLSKYTPGLDENKNADVAAFLQSLAELLRDRYRATVLIVAHTGHGDAKRPRGAYSLTANPDAEFIAERPDGANTVTVSRERYKDSPSLPPLAYSIEQVDLGRVDELGDRVTSLVLRQSEQIPTRVRGAGINQIKSLTALREWARTNPTATHISSIDVLALLKNQGIARQRRPDVLNYLVNARVITSSVGGYSVHQEML